MFVRIYWGKIQPGTWSEIEETYRALNAIPIPGLLARWVTQDVNDPESMFTITLWNDMASVQAWEASVEYRNIFLARVRPFVIGSHSVSLCEVKVDNMAGLLDFARRSEE
jgi:heme-degrading monooxygenase HmoA